MSVNHTLPNGEIVPVPQDIVAKSRVAEQGFYDGQVARIIAEGFVPAPVDPVEVPSPAAPVEE